MRKPDFCLCENKGADQLRSNCEADQRFCFRYADGTIPLLFKTQISSFYPSSVAAQARLCRTWSENSKTGFLALRLKCNRIDRSALAVICRVIIHCLEVSCKDQIASVLGIYSYN